MYRSLIKILAYTFNTLILNCIFACGVISADEAPYQYKLIKQDQHVIHLITLNPSQFDIEFVKACNQVFGRETVSSIAKRKNATIAVNAGFFEIGSGEDGMPSGTLLIDGKIYGLARKKHACLFKDEQGYSIKTIDPDLNIKLGDKTFPIHQINRFPSHAENILLFTSTFGKTTLTSYRDRQEVAFNSKGEMIDYYPHGDVNIPLDGFVISFPHSFKINPSTLPKHFSLSTTELPLENSKISAVMGLPQILRDSKPVEDLDKYHLSSSQPHARVAVGIKPNKDIVILLAEHSYQRNFRTVTLGEVREMIHQNQIKLAAQYKKSPNNLTLSELKEIIKQEYSSKDAAVGLTLPEMANLMLEHGCESAINLDGGGSATLWLEDKIVNVTVGDQDEGEGRKVERPVSDALIFKKQSKIY